MRKLILSTVAFLSFGGAFAQIVQQGSMSADLYHVIPKRFAYDGVATFASLTEQERAYCFTVYNDDVEQIKSFTYETNSEYEVVALRRKEGFTLEGEYKNAQMDGVETWEDAKALAKDMMGGECIEKEGYKLWPASEWDYFDAELNLGTKECPRFYFQWNPEEKCLFRVECQYRHALTGDWVEIGRYTNGADGPLGFELLDSDFNGSGMEVILSQTLFNTDDKYEFMVPAYAATAEPVVEEYDNDGDGIVDHRNLYYGKQIGYNVVSEDGTIVQTVSTSVTNHGYDWARIWIVNEKVYLIFDSYKDDKSSIDLFKVDKQTNSITRVGAMEGMRVRPAVAECSQDIIVELTEGSNAKEIVVVNANGQTVKRIPVAAGQKLVKFNAGSIGKGMNIVNARGLKSNNSKKVIVK